MNFNEYRPLALRTAKMFPTQRENLRHALLGLMTEVGEFATEVKRIAVYGKPVTLEMWGHMREELGDTLWYVPLAMLALGIAALPQENPEFDEIPRDDLAEATLCLGAAIAGLQAMYCAKDYDDPIVPQLLASIVYTIDKVIAPLLGTTGDQLRVENVAKLRKRFPDAYTDAAAEARADKGGLDARNS